MTIPRIIHQTWKSREVPEPLRGFSARFRELNPGFEHRLWTDQDNDAFVRDEFPQFYAMYRGFSREIYRADVARCLYLWRFGGVYVDLDIEPLQPLDAFLENAGDCVLGAEPEAHARKRRGSAELACNAVLASTAGHPFWARMLAEIERRAAAPGGEPVGVTGPIALQAAYEKHGAALGVRVSEPDAFFPLPDVDAQSLPIDDRARKHFRAMRKHRLYPRSSFGVHHWAHTWIPEAGLNRRVQRWSEASREAGSVLRGHKTIDELVRPERYELAFPENAFVPRPERQGMFRRRVAAGREAARSRRLTVLTLLHNRVDLALLLRARVQALLALFGGGRALIIADDSTDGTERVIADWAAADPARVLRVPPPRLERGLSSFARMARLRNALCGALDQEDDTDLVAVLDGDLEGPLSLDGVAHAVALLSEPSGPDAVAALGINNWLGLPILAPFIGYGYYDPIAFRERDFARRDSDASVRLRLAGLRRGDAPLPVLSAFAGLALYRGEIARGLRYDERTTDCEHVSYHRALAARGGKLVLDPSLMLLAGRQGHHRTKSA